MVPAIRTILGGFLFHGDDVYKKAGVLSGGERTRLAVARMLLRPSNTLLLDEPTNHLDMDSKDVLLDALEDFGGTLILVSHDRYFIDRLATKTLDVGGGGVVVYPGGYEEYRWSLAQRQAGAAAAAARVAAPARPPAPARVAVQAAVAQAPTAASSTGGTPAPMPGASQAPVITREQKKQLEAEQRRHRRSIEALRARIADLETRIAEREAAIKEVEVTMSAPGFYSDHEASKPVLDRHQALMWDVGDLMNQWEMLQQEIEALDTNAPKPPAVS
jgi:ATP-binding cassette subfamily F protein 3